MFAWFGFCWVCIRLLVILLFFLQHCSCHIRSYTQCDCSPLQCKFMVMFSGYSTQHCFLLYIFLQMYSTCLWESNVPSGQTFIVKQKCRVYSRYSHLSMNFRSQFLNTHLLYINIKNSLSNRTLFICARVSTLSHIYVWQLFGNSKVQSSVTVLLK